jgi:hypothetical protein
MVKLLAQIGYRDFISPFQDTINWKHSVKELYAYLRASMPRNNLIPARYKNTIPILRVGNAKPEFAITLNKL